MAPRLHDLREMDEWKRFANAAVQEELIAKAEALRDEVLARRRRPKSKPDGSTAIKEAKPEDIEKAARELHEIQERWKQVAEAPRAQAQALWHRYRQAADPIQAKAREFFAQRAEERSANLRAQDGPHRARRGARRIHGLDQDGRRTEEAAGRMAADRPRPASGHEDHLETLPRRLRSLLHAPQRRPHRTQGNVGGEPRQERRALRPGRGAGRRRASGTGRAAEIRRLQAEWKTIGPVRRSKSEAIWQRFRTACDTFFERYKRRDEIELEAKQADREALVVELEALAAPAQERRAHGRARRTLAARARETPPAPPRVPDEVPSDLLERVRSLRTRWNQTSSGGAAGRRSAERAIHRRAGAAPDRPPRRIQGHRARRRGEPAEDGEALRARRGLPGRRRARAGGLAGAGRNAARGARLEHDRRQAPARNRSGGRWPTKCARRRRRGAASAPSPAKPAASSPNGSTRRATASSSSSGARCRRRQPAATGTPRWGAVEMLSAQC